MKPLIIGVALALIDESGELIEVADMPILAAGPAGRRAVNPALLADIIGRWRASRAIVEYVGARPGEGQSAHSPSGARAAS
jgi:hypothetical protein